MTEGRARRRGTRVHAVLRPSRNVDETEERHVNESVSCEQTANAAVLFDVEAPQPAVVKLTAEGNRTFACSLPQHCENGQVITVHTGNSTVVGGAAGCA